MGKGLFGSMRGGFPVYFEPFAGQQQQQYAQGQHAAVATDEKVVPPKGMSGQLMGLQQEEEQLNAAGDQINSLLRAGLEQNHNNPKRFMKTDQFKLLLQAKDELERRRIGNKYTKQIVENNYTLQDKANTYTSGNAALGNYVQVSPGRFLVVDTEKGGQKEASINEITSNNALVPITYNQHLEHTFNYAPLYKKDTEGKTTINEPSFYKGERLFNEKGVPLYQQRYSDDLDKLKEIQYTNSSEQPLSPAALQSVGIDPTTGKYDLLRKVSTTHITNADQFKQLSITIKDDISNYLSPQEQQSLYQDYLSNGRFMTITEVTKDKEGNDVVTRRPLKVEEYFLHRFEAAAQHKKINETGNDTSFIKGPTAGVDGTGGNRGLNYISTALEAPNAGLKPINEKETTTYFTGKADATKVKNGQIPYTMAIAPNMTYTMPRMGIEVGDMLGLNKNVQNPDGSYDTKQLKTVSLNSAIPDQTIVLTGGTKYKAPMKISDFGPNAQLVSISNKIIAGANTRLDDKGNPEVSTDYKGNIEWGVPYMEATIAVQEDYIEQAKLPGTEQGDFYLAGSDTKLRKYAKNVENDRALDKVFGHTETYGDFTLAKRKEPGMIRSASEKGGSHAVRLIKIQIPIDPMFAAQGGEGAHIANSQLLSKVQAAVEKFKQSNLTSYRAGQTNLSDLSKYLGNPNSGMTRDNWQQPIDPNKYQNSAQEAQRLQKEINELYTEQSTSLNTDTHVIK